MQRSAAADALASILSDDVLRSDTGIAVVGADGSPLFTRRARAPVVPASTLKLVIAASVLNVLGPQYRFETDFVAEAPPAGGILPGPLWLVGRGDPWLTAGDVRNGVGVLFRSGIRQIGGPLYVDDTAFAGPEQNPRWLPDDLSYDYAAGTSALSLDQNVIEFHVTPTAPGEPAEINVVPANRSVRITGSIRTGPSGDDSLVTIERVASRPPEIRFEADGHIAPGEMQIFYKPVTGLPEFAGGAVAAMLAEREIDLPGGYGAGPAPLAVLPLWRHRSAPLAEIVREMLVNSNNHTAEQLLRALGGSGGRPGSDAAGIAREKSELQRLGVPLGNLRLFDGSGLAPDDRIAPLTLADLIAAESRTRNGDVFVRCLARAGFEGTVARRVLADGRGRVRAKTGHMENVNGLAGTVLTKHHGRVAFAFVVNDPRADADVVIDDEDRALDALADL